MKITNIHTVAALSGALALGLVLVVTSAARGTTPQIAAAWPPHPRDMVLLHFDAVGGQQPGSPPVIDYQVPDDAYFVLTGSAGGTTNAFDLIDASSGTIKVPRNLVNAIPWTREPGDGLGIVFPPGGLVAWKYSLPTGTGGTLVERLLEGYLVRHNRFASQ